MKMKRTMTKHLNHSLLLYPSQSNLLHHLDLHQRQHQHAPQCLHPLKVFNNHLELHTLQ